MLGDKPINPLFFLTPVARGNFKINGKYSECPYLRLLNDRKIFAKKLWKSDKNIGIKIHIFWSKLLDCLAHDNAPRPTHFLKFHGICHDFV